VARPLLLADLIAHLALREGVPTHSVQLVQRVAVSQLGLARRAELLRRAVRIELGGGVLWRRRRVLVVTRVAHAER